MRKWESTLELIETQYIFVQLNTKTSLNKILQNMDTNVNQNKQEFNFLFQIYLHTFFLSILFYPYIFHYNHFDKNCNKKSVPSLQILKL